MNKIILQAKSKDEAERLLKKNMDLSKDETFVIRELKKPFKFLFFESKGKYEISIYNKNEIKTEKVEKKEKKEKKVKEPVEKVKTEKHNAIEKLVETKVVDFLKVLGLDLKITSISREKHLVFVNLEGKDVKYIIGEKGIALNSMEYLFNSIKALREVKVIFDANNYREKRDASLILMANKKAKKVLETKSFVKLYPMTSKERRIIHEELSKYSELETKSHGIEPKRYLVIKYIGESNE